MHQANACLYCREFLLKKMNIDVSSLSQQDISAAHEVAISNNLYETIDLKKSSRHRPPPPRKPSAPTRDHLAPQLSTRQAVSTPIKPSPPPVPARERTESRNREILSPSLPSQRMKGIASLPMATQRLKPATNRTPQKPAASPKAAPAPPPPPPPPPAVIPSIAAAPSADLGSERPRKKEAAPQPGNNDLLKDIR